VVFKMKNCTRL